MQTQRGLGGYHFLTLYRRHHQHHYQGLDAKKGGSVWYGMGNNALNDVGFSVSTGLMKNGWAISILGSRKWGDGYIQGTQFEAWNYFANVSKKIGDSHQLSLTAFGSPQWHNQRNMVYGALSIENWQQAKEYMNGKSMYSYNPSTVSTTRDASARLTATSITSLLSH